MLDRNRAGQRGSTIIQRMAALAIVGILAAVAFARCGEAAEAADPARAVGLQPAGTAMTPDSAVDPAPAD